MRLSGKSSHGADTRLAGRSAAAICAGAAALNVGEVLLPGDPAVSLGPGVGAVVLIGVLLLLGPRLPAAVLACFAPLGVVFIGIALATTRTYGDAAVLYMWPAVWTAYFFGLRATVLIVAWTSVVHASALLALPDAMSSIDRWLDVTVAVAVVAGVVRWLAWRNETLVASLRRESRSDALTGLLNRRGFEERFAVEAARSLRSGRPLAAVALDIDHFKHVNDLHGHEMGDRVLTWLGALVAGQVRRVDIAARIGGEEFVVVLPDTSADVAQAFAQRLVDAVAGHRGTDPTHHGVALELPVTISAGVATASTDATIDDLLGRADEALYAAKAAGRNRVGVRPSACPGGPRQRREEGSRDA